MLYIVATPIGNLEDITLRALSTLKLVDYILCEDTRRTKILLSRYEIGTRTYSFHSFSEHRQEDRIIADLQSGKKIALVSDAGTPAISDPGTDLVNRCHNEGIPVTSLPGASAVTVAVSLSGIDSLPFQFLGFFPKKQGEMEEMIGRIATFQGPSLFFESPHRILKTLKAFPAEAKICLFKELTKTFETVLRGTASALYETLSKQEVRGEFVVMVEPFEKEAASDDLLGQVATLLEPYLSKTSLEKLLEKVKKRSSPI